MFLLINIRKKNYIFSIFTLSIIFLLFFVFYGTGFHGDDLSAIIQYKYNKFNFFTFDIKKLDQNFFAIFNYLFFYWIYIFVNLENYFVLDTIKYLIHLFSFVLLFIFFNEYFDKFRSSLLVIIFLIYPIHDSINFWYMTTPWFFTLSLIFFSFHLLNKDKYSYFYLFSFIGAFSSYSSPPYFIGLSYIYLVNKNYKKFIHFITPLLFYLIFYLLFRNLYPEHEHKIENDINFYFIIKNFVLIIFSSIESLIGPSFWLKIFFSIREISTLSLFISIIICAYILYLSIYFKNHKLFQKKEIIISFFIIFLSSCCMFSLTGRYLIIDFNLGNRVTIYLTLLSSLIIITYFHKKIIILICFVFIFSFVGLSDHWKKTFIKNKQVIHNIYNNTKLTNINDNLLLVLGHRYSKLSFIDNIEFLSMPWVLNDIFYDSHKLKNVISLSSYLKINNNYIYDSKFKTSYKFTNKIYLYDLNKNKIIEISENEILNLIKSHEDIRHWYQFYNNKLLNKLIISLSPRLIYIIKEN